MAINGCFSKFLVTVAAALLLVPAQYFMPDLYSDVEDKMVPVQQPAPPLHETASIDLAFIILSPVDLFLTVFLFMAILISYVCEWCQRKLLERRIKKLNQFLSESLEHLSAWDVQQDELEATLKMVQNATSEYNLMLFLLLRQQNYLSTPCAPASHCFLGKKTDDDLHFLRNPIVES